MIRYENLEGLERGPLQRKESVMRRARITITLRRDVLPRIDALINGAQIRNRSHAIEYLIQRALPPPIRQAVVLAGGLGIKMRPFTFEQPKAMLPVAGKPILEHIITRLRDAGIREITIVLGPKGSRIRDYFGDGAKFAVSLSYVEERQPLGTAAPLRLVRSALTEGPFLLHYGDVLADIDIADLAHFHDAGRAEATLALTTTDDPSLFGAVRMHGARIVDFAEKVGRGREVSRLVFAGVAILEPDILNRIPKHGLAQLERDVFPKLARERKLAGYLFEGRWYDVGTLEVYEQAVKDFATV